MNQLYITRLIITGSIILMPGIAQAHEVGGHAWSGIEFIHRLFHAQSGYEMFYFGSAIIIAVVLHGIIKDRRDY